MKHDGSKTRKANTACAMEKQYRFTLIPPGRTEHAELKVFTKTRLSGGNTKSAPVGDCSFCERGNLHGKFLQNFTARMKVFIYLCLAGQTGSQTRLHFTYAAKHFSQLLIE